MIKNGWQADLFITQQHKNAKQDVSAWRFDKSVSLCLNRACTWLFFRQPRPQGY